MNKRYHHGFSGATAVVCWYLIFGAVWILGSDLALAAFFPGQNVQTVKGLLFIAVTAALVFWLVRRLEHRQEESEALQQAIIEASPSAVFSIDVDGKVLTWNKAAERIFGWTAGEVIGRMLPIVPRDKESEFAAIRERLSAHNQVAGEEVMRLRKNGELFPGRLSAAPVHNSAGEVVAIMAIMDDITEQKRASEALKDAVNERERLQKAIEQSAESIVITDTGGNIVHVNGAFERSSGYTRDEVIGQSAAIQKSGQHDPSFYEDMWRTIRNGDIWRGNVVNRHKEGTHFTEDVSIAPVFSDGKLTNFVAVKRDITQELNLRHQLNQAQKMETVGRLAGGVAHDFNNMLSVILGYTEIALGQLPESDPVRESLAEVRSAAKRSADLTRQLLAFARKQLISPEVLDLNATVSETLKMLQRLIGENVDLSWEPGINLWPVKMDPVQLDQILANLAINARDAIDENGNLTIKTANVKLEEEDCRDIPGLFPGRYVLLSVSDDGSGMDENVAEQIFEPFFTTKPEVLGTGLGLSTVYGIVKQNGGFIRVDSQPGAGTAFDIYLPRFQSEALGSRERQRAANEERGSETILLVEDEQALLKLARRILESLGYNVISTESPREAIELAETHGADIRLLMTDLVMPEMNGHDLYQKIHRSVPHIKPLFTSGYTATIHHDLVEEGQKFLQKPYSSTTLSNKVREALDG